MKILVRNGSNRQLLKVTKQTPLTQLWRIIMRMREHSLTSLKIHRWSGKLSSISKQGIVLSAIKINHFVPSTVNSAISVLQPMIITVLGYPTALARGTSRLSLLSWHPSKLKSHGRFSSYLLKDSSREMMHWNGSSAISTRLYLHSSASSSL